jgi:hypothetical protein
VNRAFWRLVGKRAGAGVTATIIFRKSTGKIRVFSYQIGTAQQLPALNPHLTKSRLNDAPRLCEMLLRNSADDRAQAAVRMCLRNALHRTAASEDKVETVWMQGG